MKLIVTMRRPDSKTRWENAVTVRAVCALKGDKGVSGVLRFEQSSSDAPTKITGEITGLTQGKHGLHVHEYGDITRGCESAGPHFNPYKQTHGGPTDKTRHVGDLGNVDADSNGVAKINITDRMIALTGDPDPVVAAVEGGGGDEGGDAKPDGGKKKKKDKGDDTKTKEGKKDKGGKKSKKSKKKSKKSKKK